MPRSGDEQDCTGCGERLLWCVPRGMGDGRNERRARLGDALGWWEAVEAPFRRHHCKGADVSLHRIANVLDLVLAGMEERGNGAFTGIAAPVALAGPARPERTAAPVFQEEAPALAAPRQAEPKQSLMDKLGDL